MNTQTYDACNDCAYYLTTGDCSGLAYWEQSVTQIDETQVALQIDDNIVYWLESVVETDCSMGSCTFCGADAIINKQVQGVIR